VLQRVAVCCGVWQCIAVCCSVLQFIAICVMLQQFAKEGENESLQVCQMCPICTKRDLEN